MPVHPSPPLSVPEPSGKPVHPSADTPPPGSDADTSKPTGDATLFHLLVERGWDPNVAYTADQRIHTMASEIAAAGLQPVLAELREVRQAIAEIRQAIAEMHGRFATKADLAGFATKADLADLRREMAERETRIIKWMFGAMAAQTALIVGLVKLL